MTDFVSTRRRLPGGTLSPATALTLDRVRLGAGGPLVRLRVAGGRVTHVVAEEGTGGRARRPAVSVSSIWTQEAIVVNLPRLYALQPGESEPPRG